MIPAFVHVIVPRFVIDPLNVLVPAPVKFIRPVSVTSIVEPAAIVPPDQFHVPPATSALVPVNVPELKLNCPPALIVPGPVRVSAPAVCASACVPLPPPTT